MKERELFRRFPALRGRIPWVDLAQLPTPLEPLAITLPGGRAARITVKRDDLSGVPYGGNKVRKLEFLLADAKARGAVRVLTAGAFGSHHALATTVYAQRLGLDCTVVLFPQRITGHVRDIVMMIAALGADIRFTRRMEFVPVALARVRRSLGPGTYVVPPGGSNALGTLGYVECGLELAQQWSLTGTAPPARIHVAAGTLGTTAGLAIGLAIAGVECDVAATRITSPLVTNDRALNQLVRETLALLEQPNVAMPNANDVVRRVSLIHDQIGEGYGRATPASEVATEIFAEAGLALDPTYTAKSVAALLADPATARGETMYLHTLSAVDPVHSLPEVASLRLPHQIATRISQLT